MRRNGRYARVRRILPGSAGPWAGGPLAKCSVRSTRFQQVRDLLHVYLKERERDSKLPLVRVLLDIVEDVVNRSRHQTILKLLHLRQIVLWDRVLHEFLLDLLVLGERFRAENRMRLT